MSDRPEESRPPSENAGGWFVPKNAMTEQEMTAYAQSQPDGSQTNETPMPGSTPQQNGDWYVPPEAAERAAALTPKPAIDVPAGAALSTEADYSNYVPGKGFVSSAEAASSATSDPLAASVASEVSAVDQDPSEPLAQDPASVYTPRGDTGKQAAAVVVAESPAEVANVPADDAPVEAPPEAVTVAEPVAEAPVAPKPVSPELLKRYEDVEKAVHVLRRRYNSGTLTRAQLQDELRKLMILDEDGYWWMIGLETDRWYNYNGKDWIPSARPGKPQDDVPAGKPAANVLSRVSGSTQPSAQPYDVGPLPQRVPIFDPGATMVNLAAPRLDSVMRSKEPVVEEPTSEETIAVQPVTGTPRYLDRASRPAASTAAAGFDGGMTMPSGTSQVTQPMAAVAAGAVPAAAGRGTAGTSPGLQPGEQPDYGTPPSGVLADRQRATGCLVRVALVSFFLALIGTLVGLAVVVFGYFSIIQRYDSQITKLGDAVQAAAQSARIMDKNGRVLYQINDPNSGARIQVPLNKISPYLIAATIRTEDQRFYDNPGFDPVGIVRAITSNLSAGGAVSGASGLTQQLTRALVLDPGAAQDRSSSRKITEIIVSSEVARRYTKSQILEFYLNTVYYGNLSYGIEAASQTYFNKSAKDLNLAESAFLAGLVQAPATYDPVLNRDATFKRMDDILALLARGSCIQMEHAPYDKGQFCVNKADVDAAVVLVAQIKAKVFRPPTNTAIYPHFVNYVQQLLEEQFGKDALYSSGFNVYTTIDPKVQDIADQAVKTQIAALKALHVTNGAVLAIKPDDGAIVAMVGSVDFNSKDIPGQFNVTVAPRQPGSSIKPFVYLAAMERDPNNNYMTPSTIIWDVPSCFGAAPGYCPRNYDGRFHGPQSMRNSIDNSFNIPAVKTLQFVGIDRFKAFTTRIGVEFPLTQPETAGLGSALGGVEVPLIDMVRGYSVIANGGKRVDSYAITKVTTKDGDQEKVVFEAKDHPASQVIEPAIAYLMTNILSDNAARQQEFGNALALSDGRPAAVKTGTTNDSKDNWTIGYTPQLVVGVWVGNNDNTPMQGTSGVTGAAPIWKQVMVQALAGQPVMQFQAPPNVQQATICADYGTLDFPDCPNRRTDVYFAPNPPPSADALFKTVQVDSFSGLIANNNCPDYVENRTFLVINDETAIAWLNADPAGQKWATDHKLTLPVVPPPTASCDANTPRPTLRISNPQPNQSVNGLVEVRGSVFVPGFNRYQIEVGEGLNATQFTIVDGPTSAQPSGDNSFLGRWDTTTRPNGAYTVRLFAVDGQGRNAKLVIPVIVNNLAGGAATATPGNNATITPGGNPTDVPIVPTQPPGGFVTQPPAQLPTDTNGNPVTIQPALEPSATLRPIFPPTSAP